MTEEFEEDLESDESDLGEEKYRVELLLQIQCHYHQSQ